MLSIQTRREFLAALSATCTASVLLGRANAVVQDGPPETTKIRIAKGPPPAGLLSTSLTHSYALKALSKSRMWS